MKWSHGGDLSVKSYGKFTHEKWWVCPLKNCDFPMENPMENPVEFPQPFCSVPNTQNHVPGSYLLTASGWWFFATRLKKYEFVSWDDDSSQLNQYMESHKSHVPNHRPGLYLFLGVQLNGVFLFLLAVLKRKRWRSGEKDLVTTRHRNWEFKRLLWKDSP